jgi:hypothetical protein
MASSERIKYFWRDDRERNFPPESVRSPEQYDGGDRINVVYTQTELSPSAQRKLVDSWCTVLPTLSSVRYIWFNSHVPQQLFDVACRIPNLEGLYVKWSRIKSLCALPESNSLKYLHIGGSAQVQSIEPLRQMTQLRWLGLENLKRIRDISALSSLSDLEGLAYTGGMWGKPIVQTLSPLVHLTSLRWLALHSLHVEDASLEPIARLSGLQYLSLPNSYPTAEYARILAKLPHTDHSIAPLIDLSRMGLVCKRCKHKSLVMPIGKGIRKLCRFCDGAKVKKLEDDFAALAAQFA